GLTPADLEDLGIDADVVRRAFLVVDDDEMLELAASVTSAWQGEAIVDLCAGTPIEELRAKLVIEPAVVDDETDDALLDALRHPAARMTFAFVDDDEELRAAIEDEDFGRWRVFLHPEQRSYATRDRNGAFRLSGGAGTGKTVVL